MRDHLIEAEDTLRKALAMQDEKLKSRRAAKPLRAKAARTPQ
jgi:hypothetical protein